MTGRTLILPHRSGGLLRSAGAVSGNVAALERGRKSEP